MGSNETATATTGGPRVIGVFYGNGAPSGPNYVLFSVADRPSDALRDRSEVGWSRPPHTPALGALLPRDVHMALIQGPGEAGEDVLVLLGPVLLHVGTGGDGEGLFDCDTK